MREAPVQERGRAAHARPPVKRLSDHPRLLKDKLQARYRLCCDTCPLAVPADRVVCARGPDGCSARVQGQARGLLPFFFPGEEKLPLPAQPSRSAQLGAMLRALVTSAPLLSAFKRWHVPVVLFNLPTAPSEWYEHLQKVARLKPSAPPPKLLESSGLTPRGVQAASRLPPWPAAWQTCGALP